MIYEEKSYQLKLSNGHGWELKAHNGVSEWLDKLAYIMRLGPSETDRFPKNIFCKIGDFPRVKEHYSAEDWFAYNNRSFRTWASNTISDVICEVNNAGNHDIEIVNMWNSLFPIYQRVQDGGGLPFHATLLELDGRGVLVAAPGDTGKSTCYSRVPNYWKPLCDDEALVVCGPNNEYRAHPFPTWSEYLWKTSNKSWNVQYSVPLRAIFFLEQAESDKITDLGEGQAAVYINQSATQVSRKFWRRLDKETKNTLVKLQFNNAVKMTKHIPSFTLHATLHGKFWEEIEKVLV